MDMRTWYYRAWVNDDITEDEYNKGIAEWYVTNEREAFWELQGDIMGSVER